MVENWPKTPVVDLEKEELGENEKWDKAELYMKQLTRPPSIHGRLVMWKFKTEWQEEKEALEEIVAKQRVLYNEVKTNKYMHRILARALAIGNVINGGTAKGQADGFDMGVVSG